MARSLASQRIDHPARRIDLDRIRGESFVRQVVFRPVVASTNDLALELALGQRCRTPLLVLAETQTAGRGRGSRRWWSAAGALTCSVILDPEHAGVPRSRWPRLSLAAASAVCETIAPLLPHVACGLRWPNDVYAAGRKVGGVLVEVPAGGKPFARERGNDGNPGAAAARAARQRLVVGLGVNVNNSLAAAPAEVSGIGTSLCDLTGQEHDWTELLVGVLRRFEAGLESLARGDAQLSRACQRRCLLRDRVVHIDVGARVIFGRCQGIDAEGALVLETPDGRKRFFGGTLRRVE